MLKRHNNVAPKSLPKLIYDAYNEQWIKSFDLMNSPLSLLLADKVFVNCWWSRRSQSSEQQKTMELEAVQHRFYDINLDYHLLNMLPELELANV